MELWKNLDKNKIREGRMLKRNCKLEQSNLVKESGLSINKEKKKRMMGRKLKEIN